MTRWHYPHICQSDRTAFKDALYAYYVLYEVIAPKITLIHQRTTTTTKKTECKLWLPQWKCGVKGPSDFEGPFLNSWAPSPFWTSSERPGHYKKKKKYWSAEIYWLLALKEPKLVYKASNKNFSLQVREKSGCVLLKISKFCSPQTEVCCVAGCLSSCPLCLWPHGCWWLASIWSGGTVRVIIQLFKEWRWFFLLKELPPEAITFWHQNRVRQHLFNTLELS